MLNNRKISLGRNNLATISSLQNVGSPLQFRCRSKEEQTSANFCSLNLMVILPQCILELLFRISCVTEMAKMIETPQRPSREPGMVTRGPQDSSSIYNTMSREGIFEMLEDFAFAARRRR